MKAEDKGKQPKKEKDCAKKRKAEGEDDKERKKKRTDRSATRSRSRTPHPRQIRQEPHPRTRSLERVLELHYEGEEDKTRKAKERRADLASKIETQLCAGVNKLHSTSVLLNQAKTNLEMIGGLV